jgi:aspartate aminotransferase-like enzyme
MIDDTLTMIPGPTPVHGRILEALGRPTVSHLAPGFVDSFRGCLHHLKRIAMAEEAQPFVVSGAGTLAMEMALVNLVAPGETLLVLSQGYFGDRWRDLADSYGVEHELVQAEWGRAVPVKELARRLDGGGIAAVAMTHVDTSTGTAAPVEEYCRVLRDHDTLSILDGVCATGGMVERFDDWGLDLLLTGAQKAFGAPPGLALLLASRRAMARRESRSGVPAYYADLLRWRPIMEDPGRYFSTPPVNAVVALHEATRLILDEGLEARFERHRRIAEAVRAGLEALGLAPFPEPDRLAPTLTVARYPEGVEDGAFRAEMARRGVVVAGGLGPVAGKVFRVGHMGNIGAGEVCRFLRAAEDTLRALGLGGAPGAALASAAAALDRVS